MRFLLATSALFASILISGCGGVVTAAVPAIPAAAPTVVLNLSYNSEQLTLELPASPTPATYGSGYNFTVQAMATLSTGATCKDGLEFYTNPVGGGGFADSCIEGLAPYIDQGIQMFSGSVTEPTFIPGTYQFSASGMPGVLTIALKAATAASASTPVASTPDSAESR